MLNEITELVNLQVVTEKGKVLGRISDVIIDLEKGEVYEILISDTNEELVEESRNVAVPYRWIQSVSHVVVLKYFPGRVKIKSSKLCLRSSIESLRSSTW